MQLQAEKLRAMPAPAEPAAPPAARRGASADLRHRRGGARAASEAAIRVAPPPSPSLPVLEQLQAEVDRICRRRRR